jgi:serine/threonine protein kinase
MSNLVRQTLLNRYRVNAFVGRGGMAEVYKAWDARRSVRVALKVLNEDLSEDYVFLRRFSREAQALELLQHPHVVRFFGFEESPGLAFLVMEYIDGVTLRRQLRLMGRPLTLPEALTVLQPVCSALHYAHTMGIYHCDVKPANIFIEHGGRVVLGDFGIAQLTESATVTFSTSGTPAYMSPEQCRGEDLDAQTDIYSLGITTYEMLTLDRPFKGETEETTGSRGERVRWEQMHVPPPRPRSVNPGIPPAAEATVLRALEKEPDRRQQGALEFYRDLSRAVSVQPVGRAPRIVEPVAPPPGPSQPPPPPLLPLRGREERAARSRVLPTLGAGEVVGAIFAVLVCVVALALLLAWGGGIVEPPPAFLTDPPSASAVPGDMPPPTTTPPLPTVRAPTSTPTVGSELDTSTPVSTPALPLLDLVLVPGDSFICGSTRTDIERVVSQLCSVYPDSWCRMDSFEDELPRFEVFAPRSDITYLESHDVYVDSLYIAQHEVTNAEYAVCVKAGVCSRPAADGANPRHAYFDDPRSADYPVVYVTWFDAETYCNWAGARLPTADEWEKAARGTDGRWWPWGDQTPSAEVNFRRPDEAAAKEEDTILVGGDLAPVGSHPADTSPYGVMDMAGNVMEWVDAWYGSGKREIRGGSWNTGSFATRAAGRTGREPQANYFDVGFRCSRDAEP